MSRATGVSNMGEIVNQVDWCDRSAWCYSLEMLLQEVCRNHGLCQTEDKHFYSFGIGG